jgi:hypothetical protein
MQIFFLTFATSDLHRSLKRICLQANKMGLYDEIYTWDEKYIDENYFNSNKDKLVIGSRGFGYWSWKPQIIMQALDKMEYGDILQYTDAGCHLNPRGKWRLKEYLLLTKSSETGILAFQGKKPEDPLEWDGETISLGLEERKWIKGDLLDYFSIRDNQEILNSPTIGAGIIFIKKTPKTIEIIKKWASAIKTNFSLIDDSPSKSENPSGFIEHRHDQSIFSVLCKLNSVQTLSAYEYWYPIKNKMKPNWKILNNYPIHAKRDLDYGVIGNYLKLLIKLKRKILRHFYEN